MAHTWLRNDIQEKHQAKSPQLIPISPRSPQSDSAFFTYLPSEIRIKIYEATLTPKPAFTSINFRRNRTQRADEANNAGASTSLLATCTRIYTETYCLLYKLNEINVSLEGSYSAMTPLLDSMRGRQRKQYVFPPRGDLTFSDAGDVQLPEITYGGWRHYLRPEQWAVATLAFYIDPYWPSWSNLGADCLAWWTKDPVVRPREVRLVIWVVAQFDSIPFQMGRITQAMKHAKGLKKGVLELRTLRGREKRLDEYILKLLETPIGLAEGGVLKWDKKIPIVWDGEKETEYTKVGMDPEDCVVDSFSIPSEEKGYQHEPEEMEWIWWIRIGWIVTDL